MKTFNKGGVHPPQCKLTAATPITRVELPREVVLTFVQQIGASGTCVVNKGDTVTRGDMVVKASGLVSANVHTPISGTVTAIGTSKTAYGYPAQTLTVTATEEEHIHDINTLDTPAFVRDDRALAELTPEAIRTIVADAGIVGLGGATFPTRVKLAPPPDAKPDILIVNGVECEPYLTCDHALMLAHPAEIVAGTVLAMRAAGVSRGVIAVEANKRDAIERLHNQVLATGAPVEVVTLKVKYPQGGEKQLIKAVTGREVPSGALPVKAGAVVQNVATIYAIYRAARFAEPLMDRVVTVTGPSVSNPGNYRVPVGYPLRNLVELAGGIPEDTGKVILGGPMMGKAVASVDAPLVKGVSGIVMLPQSQSLRLQPQPCVRCGGCVEACPMGLEPLIIATFSRLNRFDDAERHGIMDCIECGSCSFTCPAARPLLDYIRVGKLTVAARRRSRPAKEG
ncbi:MAG: electron transport complex subunit RsxC [Candidatus Amulumruptor caecigallinarius]|nr:electron transport complex subunit RsxC [Candidatus Amulumruptor caecigallinarius]MCM1396845.1 electron transport complex subunit RsxC [Candidatus Amulumruptor caecigallinarius]MCM1454211.1 electron transport complex subunit RsxC [bacterium]